MRIGDKIKIGCTDTGKSNEGVVHRISKDKIDVVIGNGAATITLIKQPNRPLYVGNKSGMEFTFKAG